MRKGPGSAHVVLFAAVFAVSTAAPFLVMARMDAYAVVFWRLALSSLLFFVYAGVRGTLRVPVGQRARLVAGALFLVAHFILWVKAFDLTDYASNLLLLVAQPVTAAVIGRLLGEPLRRAAWFSIALATVGLMIIAGGDFGLGPRALLGDAMCILGGLCITMFYVVTREVRTTTPLATFMAYTFAVGAAVVLVVALAAGGAVFRQTPSAWAWVAALVLVTTVTGHGLMNVAARHVSLFSLNIVIVLEPAIGIGIGAVMFGAAVRPLVVVGGGVLIAAVVVGLAHRDEERGG